EIALAVVLLVGAGLMMKSLLRLVQSDVGFNPQNVLTMTVVLPTAKYTDANKQVEFFDQLKQRIQSLPGVAGSGTVDNLPLNGGNTTRFYVDGDPVPPPGQAIEANFRVVDESYFQTLGVPLIAGRLFDRRDTANPNPNATGVVIVGVVGNVKIAGLDEAIKPVLYYPFRQAPSTGTNLVVRTNADPTAL